MSTQFLTAEEVADLGMRLRAAGYGVGPDQCIAAQRLMLMLAAQGMEFADRRGLKSWLAPVFCSNPTEQADFAAHYEEWLSGKDGALPLRAFALAVKTLQPSGAAPARISHLRQAMVLAVVLLVLAGALFRGKQIRSELIYRTVRVRVVDQENIVLRDAVLSFRGARIQPQADGLFTIGFRLIDLPAKIVATKNNYEDSIDLDTRDYQQTQTLRLGPLAVAQTTHVEPQQNDRLLLTAAESFYLRKTLSVVGPTENKPGTEQPSTPQRFYERHYRDFLIVSASLPLFLAGLWLLWVHLPRLQLIRWKSQKDIRLESLRVRGSEADFFNRPAFRRIAQQLRRHRLAESTDLDPERTVFESANRAGWFTPVYLWRQRLPDYLILIDRAGFRDFQGRLIDDFVKSLRLGRVEIDCYDFYSDPRACYLRTDAEITGAVRKKKSRAFSQDGSTLVAVEDAPEAGNSGQRSRRVTLDDLLAKHPNHNLLIFTEATGFFSSMTGQVQPWVERFSQWTFRVVFVPEEMVQSRSNRRVAMLRDRGFLVLPASEKGWSRAVDILDSGTRVYVPGGWKSGSSSPYPSLLQSDALRWMSDIAPSPALVSLLMGQLRTYLGEEMFPWLCACAVYPELSWDLTLYLGSALKILGTDERRLATILRLPWFRKGSMPEWLRQSLTQAMQPQELERVRHALWGLLETALDHPLHSFDLRYATENAPDHQQKGWRARLRRMLLRNYLRTEADHGGLQDYVFVSVLEGRKPALGLSVPEKLRRLFGRIGKPTRPIAQLVIALLASGAITGYLYVHRPKLPSDPDAPTIPEKLPPPTGTAPYHLILASVVRSQVDVEASGPTVFQVTGDTGGANNPGPQQLVADAMASQFASAQALDLQGARVTLASLSSSRPSSSSQARNPAFLYLLGNVAYSDGETHNYSSQFYQPYRNYPAAIFAIPGNHDGIHDSDGTSLTGFVRNFCAKSPVHTPDAGGTSRTAMTEPNPYWTLETPFAIIIGMYTNVTNEGYVDKDQESWLTTELHNAPSNQAVIIAMNHSIYSMSSPDAGSGYLSRVLDRAMISAGRAPDLVLSAHEDNYQRFSRKFAGSGRVIPYIVVGTGGYPNLKKMPAGLKTPTAKGGDLVLENFNDTQHGFLQLIASSSVLIGRYNTVVSTTAGGKSQVVDSFTIDLKPAAVPAPRGAIITILRGTISPRPPDPQNWMVEVVNQSISEVNKDGGFAVPIKGFEGQTVLLQLYFQKKLMSQSAHTLPGPVTIPLPASSDQSSSVAGRVTSGEPRKNSRATTTAPPPENQSPQNQSLQNQQAQTAPVQNQQSPAQQTQNPAPQVPNVQNQQAQAPPAAADSNPLASGRTFESPDKTMVARIDGEQNLSLFGANGESIIPYLAQVSSSTAVAWSADSKYLAWSYGPKITVWAQSKSVPMQLDGGSGQILVLAWSPDGRWIASGADDNVVRIWEPASGRSAVGATGPSPARNLQWSTDARQLVATWQDGTTKEIKVPSRSAAPAPPTNLQGVVK